MSEVKNDKHVENLLQDTQEKYEQVDDAKLRAFLLCEHASTVMIQSLIVIEEYRERMKREPFVIQEI